jgi:acyl-CoA thioester hydrolase
MTRFAYETETDVRYSDLDSLGHVNNAVYATYFELARVRYLQDEFDAPAEKPNFVVAHLELDFVEPITELTTVTVGMGVDDVGRTSFDLACEIEVDGSLAARGASTQVVVDDGGQPAPIPEEWRAMLEAHEAD